MVETGSGCYLTFSTSSQGTLFLNWSESPVPGALAYIKPNRPVPKFKFTAGGGKSELIRQLQGPHIKRFFQGWTQFVKLGRELNGEFIVLRGPSFEECPVAVVLNTKNEVTRVEEGRPYAVSKIDAVAALHPANDCFKVITMPVSRFREVGDSAGAALQF